MLVSVLIVSLIAAVLAALLVVARHFLNDYGECRITINDSRSLSVQGGGTLLESLTSNSVFIPSACGGRGTCAYCKVKVLGGGGPVNPVEEPYLSAKDRQDGIRLSCQIKVRNDISIEIPQSLMSIREYSCRCAGIRDLTGDIKEFRLELQEPGSMDYVPGQYIQLFCPAYDGKEEVYRAYSIASDPGNRKSIDLVIRLVPGGICTTWCFEKLKEGDSVRMNGPYGDFRLSDSDAPMVFVAGGSGMAPMKCILHHMKNTDNRRSVTYIFGARHVSDMFYGDLMKDFEDSLENFRFVPVVSEPDQDGKWKGETGLVTDALRRNVGNGEGFEGYLCGSPGMINATVEVMKELGIREENIFYDKFE